MKQKLQPCHSTGVLSLFFPAGLLDYFDLVNHVSQETCFIFFLEKAFHSSRAFSHLPLHSQGFPEMKSRLSRSRQDMNIYASRVVGRPGETGQLIVVIGT